MKFDTELLLSKLVDEYVDKLGLLYNSKINTALTQVIQAKNQTDKIDALYDLLDTIKYLQALRVESLSR